jgi:hypothetical protein
MLSFGQVSLIVCSYYFPDVQFWEAFVLIDEGAQSLTSSSTTRRAYCSFRTPTSTWGVEGESHPAGLVLLR